MLNRFCVKFAIVAVAYTLLVPVAKAADDLSPFAKHDNWVTSVSFSADGGTLATGGGQGLLYRPGDVKIWDTKTGAEKKSLAGNETAVWSVALSADGKLLASSGYDGLVKLWELPEGKLKHDLKKHKMWARTIAFYAGRQVPGVGRRGRQRHHLGHHQRARVQEHRCPHRRRVLRDVLVRWQDTGHSRRG